MRDGLLRSLACVADEMRMEVAAKERGGIKE